MIDFIKEQLAANQLLLAGVLLTGLGSILMGLKSLVPYVYERLKGRVIYTATIYQSDILFYDFETWFYTNYNQKYRNVEACIKLDPTKDSMPVSRESIKEQEVVSIKYKQNFGFFFIRYKGKFLMVRKGKEKLEHATNSENRYFNEYSISGFYAKDIIHELLIEAVALSRKKRTKNEVKVFSHTDWGDWATSGVLNSKDISNIIMPEETRELLKNDIDTFLNSKEKYSRRSILYKRGYLLYGPPGNGKSSLAFSLAGYLNRDIYSLDLGCLIGSSQLKKAFSNLNTQSVLLIEDIDSFFQGRENKTDSKISFSTFINCLDGAFYKEGLIVIISTNHKELLDQALLRAGRLDHHIYLQSPGNAEVNKYINLFYDRKDLVVNYKKDWCMSQIQDLCLSNQKTPEELISILESDNLDIRPLSVTQVLQEAV